MMAELHGGRWEDGMAKHNSQAKYQLHFLKGHLHMKIGCRLI